MESKKRVYKKYPYNPTASLARITEEQKEKVLSLYKEGMSQTKIEKFLKMTRKTIRTVLKEEGANLRSSCERLRNAKGLYLNDTVFNEITDQSAYWLGFLYADGHISKDDEGNSIEVTVIDSDNLHLDKLCKFLETNKTYRYISKSRAVNLRFGSEVIHDKLKSLGFDNHKSKTAKPPEELKYNRDFWRGVVDGDGCISKKYQNPTVHLCGTKDTIEGFIDFVRQNNIETLARARETKDRDLYQVSFECRKGRQVVELLYNDSNIYLDRKYEKVNNILKTK